MAEIICTDNIENIGNITCEVLPQQWIGLITAPVGHDWTLATAQDEAAFETAIQTKIKAAKASRAYLWPLAVNGTPNDEETTYEDLPTGRLFVRPGFYNHTFHFTVGLPQFKSMKTHHNTVKDVLFYDGNYLLGTGSGTAFKGIKSRIFVEKLMRNDGSIATKAAVSIQIIDVNQIDNLGLLAAAGFFPNLVPLTTVELTIVGTPTASEIVVDVKNVYDGSGVPGLVEEDFDVSTGTVSGVTESTSVAGRYTIAGSTFATGTVDLVAPSALSIDAYESNGAVEFTI